MRLWVATGLTAMLMLQQQQRPAPVERQPPQAPAGGFPTIRVESRLVNIPLNVTDLKDAPVGGLQKDDFEVSEEGSPQRIAVFERESSTPLSIVLAIDTSESIFNDVRLERDAAKHFVQTLLREQDEIDLMQFSDATREVVAFTNQAKKIDSGLGQLTPGSATALYNAISLASQRLGETRNDAGRRRVLVLITDGENTVKGGYQYPEAVEQAQRAGAMVYALIIVPVQADAGRNVGGEHALIQMAEDTGGKYYYVGDPRDLKDAMGHVSDDLRTQYMLGYYAPERKNRGDAFRSIRVRMKDPALDAKYKLRYRNGYYSGAK
jgi:Ca-activated chloride channel family protein